MADLVRKADGSYERRNEKSAKDERRWYAVEDPAEALWTTVRAIRNRQSYRRQSDELALQLYSDMRYVGYSSAVGNATMANVVENRLGDNVIRSIIRTLNSKIARRRARPYVVTNDGSWKSRQAAENLEKWLLGKLREMKADERLLPMQRLHALTLGTGLIRSYGDPRRGAMLEIIPSLEGTVDDSEARYGTPQNIYFVRVASAARLKADYPDKKTEIDNAETKATLKDEWANSLGAWETGSSNDLVVVIEAYHLPSGKDVGDGRHIIATSNAVLLDREWKRDHFPLSIMRGELRPAGFWGIGVPEDLAGQQLELNRNALATQEMVDMLATPYWLVERGMKVVRSHISNIIGRIVEWTPTGSGNKPELVTPTAVPPDVWQNRQLLKQSAFENRGVSQLSASMLKPLGLNSGKALRAYTELESELLVELMSEADNALLECCTLLIEEQIELAEAAEKTEEGSELRKWLDEQVVSYVGDGVIEEIHWKDIDFKNALKRYELEILPGSALASTLSGRLEDVVDLRDLGVITDPDEIHDYLELPDRRRLRRKHLAHIKLLERIIESKIIDKGETVIPEPTWDLEKAIGLALEAINELELYEDAPQSRLELLRIFARMCQLTLDQGNKLTPEEAALAAQTQGQANGSGIGTDPALAGDPLADPALALGPEAGGLPIDDPALAGVGPAIEAGAINPGTGLPIV